MPAKCSVQYPRPAVRNSGVSDDRLPSRIGGCLSISCHTDSIVWLPNATNGAGCSRSPFPKVSSSREVTNKVPERPKARSRLSHGFCEAVMKPSSAVACEVTSHIA